MMRLVLSYLLAGFTTFFGSQFVWGQTLPSVTSGNLRLWLSADVGVTTDENGAVQQWQDQSPESNAASQSDTNRQPKLVSNIFNGKPAIRFDGIQSTVTGDFLQGSGDVGLSAGFTSFIVFSRSGPPGNDQALVYVGAPGNDHVVRASYLLDGDEMAFSGWANDYGSGYHVPTNTCHIETQRLNSDKTVVDFFDWNGTNTFTSSADIFYGLGDPAAGYYIGGFPDWLLYARIDVAEVLCYQGALSDEDRSAVEDYLHNKYFSAAPPVIVVQPVTAYTSIGGTASFNVGLNQSARPLTYQWLFSNVPLDGATSSSLVITNAQASNAGNYQVLVSNQFGSASSDIVGLTFMTPVSITAQPQDQLVLRGSNALFSASASGDSPRFQWRFNGEAIAGQTSNTLSVLNVQAAQVGVYSVVVSNEISSVTSLQANLSMITPPVFTSQPQGFYGLSGTTIVLNASLADNLALPTVSSGSLQLWLKADAGVVTNGPGRVSQWNDQSGKGNHCSQSTTAKQPMLVTNAINARPAVRFDGVQDTTNGDYLQGTTSLGLTNALTSFIVYTFSPRVVLEQILTGIGVPGFSNNLRAHYLRSLGITNEMCLAAWSNDYGSGYSIPTNGVTRLWSMRISTNLTSLEFFDKDYYSSFYTNRTVSNLTTPGSGYYVGGLGSQTRNFKGDIAEYLCFRGALTDNDRALVESYLSARYLNYALNVSYQWKINGTNVIGATNATLILTNAQAMNSGNYTLTASNIAGVITSDPALVRVRNILPCLNGQFASNSVYSVTNPVSFSFVTAFTNSSIFYTLDGSVPSFASHSYTGPFSLTNSALVRGIVYSADFSQIEEADAVTIDRVPVYTVTPLLSGGGTVQINPSQANYPSNSLVTLTAVASNGWTFLGWSGDASGNNPTNTIAVTTNKTVQGIFGTTISTTTAGNGLVTRYPALPFYSYGSSVKLTAVPQSGSYFAIWGNAASGNTNPLSLQVVNPNPTVSTLFAALGANQVSLTVFAKGNGQVSANPQANVYTNGQIVTLTATPSAGQKFIGWSGDASGQQNPLSLLMNQSKAVTAVFSKGIQLTNTLLGSNAFQVTLLSPAGVYNLENSTNLLNWLPLATFTNSIGAGVQFQFPTNGTPAFYRVVEP